MHVVNAHSMLPSCPAFDWSSFYVLLMRHQLSLLLGLQLQLLPLDVDDADLHQAMYIPRSQMSSAELRWLA